MATHVDVRPETTGAEVLERVRAIHPELRARAGESEENRRVARESFRQLSEAGAFRMQLPRSVGGVEASLIEFIKVYEEVARADAAAGWLTMILGSTPLVTAHLPRETFEEIYRDPETLTGGSIVPKPMGELVGDGMRVSGQWPLNSGCEETSWVVAHVIVFENGAPRMVDGVPEMRMAVVPTDQVEILDTWYTLGLRGTGSHDMRLDDLLVDDAHWCRMTEPSPLDYPLYHLPTFPIAAMQIGAIAVGIAQGAIDEVARLASERRSHLNPTARTSEDPLLQFELGEAETSVRAARALIYEQCERLWERALEGGELAPVEWLQARSSGWYASKLALGAVDKAYALGGAGSMYDESPLQRHVRDIRTQSQHLAVNRRNAEYLGAALLGEQLSPMALR